MEQLTGDWDLGQLHGERSWGNDGMFPSPPIYRKHCQFLDQSLVTHGNAWSKH